jgi:hypothetical protein
MAAPHETSAHEIVDDVQPALLVSEADATGLEARDAERTERATG